MVVLLQIIMAEYGRVIADDYGKSAINFNGSAGLVSLVRYA